MKNKGFSLIELIIVVAIIGVLALTAAIPLSTSQRANTKKCAQAIDVLISQCKIDAMSRAGEIRLELYEDDAGAVHGAIYEDDALISDDVLGGSRITVEPLATLTFQRSTGAFESGGITAINVSGGGSTLVITLVPATGAHWLEGASDG